jgi:hypothetical protein
MSLTTIINISEEIFAKNKKQVNQKDLLNLEEKCKKYLVETNKKLKLCIDAFNDLTLEISSIMRQQFPKDKDTIMGNEFLTELIEMNFAEPIGLFINKVYIVDEYRKSIKAGNDDFFLENKDKMNNMFRFKAYWKQIHLDTQMELKNMMKVLIDLTEKYIEIKDDGNKVAEVMKKIAKF